MSGCLLSLLLAWPFARNLPDDAVVAHADGPHGRIEITASRLQRYAEQHPDRSPRALAEALLDLELLAAEAVARGLTGGVVVRDAVRQALVLAYLRDTFEAEWTKASLPESMVCESWRRNKRHFVHPELREAVHVVLMLPGAKPPEQGTPQEAAAQRLAETIAAELVGSAVTLEHFRGRVAARKAEAEQAGLMLDVQELGRFARKGAYVKAFTDPTFAVETANTATGAFQTQFGWHVAFVTGITPAQDQSCADASEEIRQRILPEVRKMKLRELTNQLADAGRALINPEPLGQLAARRGLEEKGPRSAGSP